MRPVLANLGFVLQASGLLMIFPIILAFYYNETNALISFFITSFSFFGLGFIFNALSVREEMDFKGSCILITLAFFLLALIGSVPYLYTGIFKTENIATQFSDSFFESMSGYTTVGLTLIKDPSALPKSMVLYRGLTQWIGGIGIVFLLLAFFFPSQSITITNLARSMGFEIIRKSVTGLSQINDELKKTMAHVIFVYLFYMIIFGVIIYFFFNLKDLSTSLSLLFSAFGTGGFSPITDFSSILTKPIIYILSLTMMVGGINFLIHDKIFSGRFKEVLTKEFILFIAVILIFGFLISFIAKLDYTTSFFNVISASTTTGFTTLDIATLGESAKLLFILIMLIGGMSLSTSGGIKILRLMLFFKSIPWSIKRFVFGSTEQLKIENKELDDKEIFIHLLVPLIAVLLIFVSAFVFTLYKFNFMDSLFEVTSAFSTTGFSTGITSLTLPLSLKWLLVILMLLGRIEIIPFLVILTSKSKI